MIGPLSESFLRDMNMLKRNILIVEDEYITALDLKTLLISQYPYNIEIVSSGEYAVKKALKNKFDLILMDIKLKGELDGIDATNMIRKNRDTPIVYLSGNSDLLESARLKKTKHEGILSKPIYEYELMEIINKVIPSSPLSKN
jgi:CheY-like chemotaxis protein